jgi:uncharacterized oligopeptide transporter (OPT) family protein
MFAGALAAWVFVGISRELADRCTIPVASGLIAGESLIGVAIALLSALGIMR